MELHFGLPGNESGQHVLAEGEIGGRRDGPHRHDRHCAEDQPERQRTEPQLAAAMAESVARRATSAHATMGSAICSVLVMAAVVVV